MSREPLPFFHFLGHQFERKWTAAALAVENQTRFSPQTKRGSAAVSEAAYCVRLLSLVSARSKCRPNYIYRRRLRAHTPSSGITATTDAFLLLMPSDWLPATGLVPPLTQKKTKQQKKVHVNRQRENWRVSRINRWHVAHTFPRRSFVRSFDIPAAPMMRWFPLYFTGERHSLLSQLSGISSTHSQWFI